MGKINKNLSKKAVIYPSFCQYIDIDSLFLSIFCIFDEKPNHFPGEKSDFFNTKIRLVSDSSESDRRQCPGKSPF